MKNSIFAAIAVVVLITIALVAFKKDDTKDVNVIVQTPPTTNNITTVTTDTDTTIRTLPSQAGLPAAVEAKRQAVYMAAMTKSYNAVAKEAATPFKYSFGINQPGGFEADMRNAAKTEGKSALEIIPALLSLPYAKQGDLYVWPSVFTKSAEEWTNEDIAMMKKVLTDEQIEGYRKFGAYAYYRIGITSDGKWTYYLAGD